MGKWTIAVYFPFVVCYYSSKQNNRLMNTPNWQKNSGKDKKGKGTCKGRNKARKMALKALIAKFGN